MSLLFETIRVVNGAFVNLAYHNARLNRSRAAIFGCTDTIDLARAVRIPQDIPRGTIRCRVDYGIEIGHVEFTPYQRRNVRSLTVVESDTIAYEHKYTDRSDIEALRRGIGTDDILIVKNGYITDTSFSNIVFQDRGRWITPSTPLLPGTARARLLLDRSIVEVEIRFADLRHFKKAALINAMTDLHEAERIAMDAIVGTKT